jgi:hypothetical protein
LFVVTTGTVLSNEEVRFLVVVLLGGFPQQTDASSGDKRAWWRHSTLRMLILDIPKQRRDVQDGPSFSERQSVKVLDPRR